MTATIDWEEMLKKVKLRIGVAGEENDPVLRLMLEDAVTAVTLFCNRDVFPVAVGICSTPHGRACF